MRSTVVRRAPRCLGRQPITPGGPNGVPAAPSARTGITQLVVPGSEQMLRGQTFGDGMSWDVVAITAGRGRLPARRTGSGPLLDDLGRSVEEGCRSGLSGRISLTSAVDRDDHSSGLRRREWTLAVKINRLDHLVLTVADLDATDRLLHTGAGHGSRSSAPVAGRSRSASAKSIFTRPDASSSRRLVTDTGSGDPVLHRG